MDPRNLYVLRYRMGSVGVQTGYIVASTAARAEAVGHAWCNKEPGRRFIKVEPAIIADETILEPARLEDDSLTAAAARSSAPVRKASAA